MAATRFQDFAYLGILFLFALVSANTQNIPLQDGISTGPQLLQAELMEAERQFQQFQKDFLKNYTTEEERQLRFKVFKNNMKKVKEMNELEEGTAVYGTTSFADLTSDEIPKCHGKLNFANELENISLPMAEIPDIFSMPVKWDWREKGVVTPAKDQGKCEACWAFATVGNIESQYAIKYGELLSFSEQQLVDCVVKNKGCKGGRMGKAVSEIKTMGGLQLEKDYPYVNEQQECKFNKKLVKVKLKDWIRIPKDETAIAKLLVKYGPISVIINPRGMVSYTGGVSHPRKPTCDPKEVNHSVLIVGFGVERDATNRRKIPYWIIKNNWGSDWGEQGYYRLYRGDGTCGVDQWGAYAVVV